MDDPTGGSPPKRGVGLALYGNLPYNDTRLDVSIARLESRIPKELHQAAKAAADREGRSLTDFVIAALRNAVQMSAESSTVIRLSVEAQEDFVRAMIDAPEPSNALEKAAKARQLRLRAEKK